MEISYTFLFFSKFVWKTFSQLSVKKYFQNSDYPGAESINPRAFLLMYLVSEVFAFSKLLWSYIPDAVAAKGFVVSLCENIPKIIADDPFFFFF